jgi:hypothetical protein
LWEAMCKEFRNMDHKLVWEITPTVPTQRKDIGSHWVLAHKDDGRYWARCNSNGSSQVSSKDFQANHAPVVSDKTLLLLMVSKTMFKMEAGNFNTEKEFLCGRLEEDLWMANQEGYERHAKNTTRT